ncbi:MAG: DUF6370 family protein [Gemmataceae bacterium]|nr:DUF6370 family protein [Gemmataceae bacterium]
MRSLSIGLSLCLMVALVGQARAEEKTLKGKITCAKCELKKSDKCETVIQVKEGGKDVIYYFDADSHKKYHGKICSEGVEGTVVGTVSKSGDKLVVKVTKAEFKDK